METNEITIKTQHSVTEVVEVLKSITVTDFSQLRGASNVSYYGEVSIDSFDIKDVKYSPYSATPSIQGKIKEGSENTYVKVKIEIDEYCSISKKMYFSTLLPLGLIILLLTILVFGNDFRLQGFIFSSAFIMCAFIAVALTRVSLVNMKKREFKKITTILEGEIVPDLPFVNTEINPVRF